MKISRKPISPKNFGLYVNNLWSAFTLLDNKEQIRSLFRDLFTHTEYKMFTKRLEIARRLLEGQTYEAIMQDLKVTERTISNISNILERDGEGLRLAHLRLSQLEKKTRDHRHSTRPRMVGEKVLPELLRLGAVKLTNTISGKIKQASTSKKLSN